MSGLPVPGPADRLETVFASVAFHRTLGARFRRTPAGVEVEASLGGAFESIPGRVHGGVVASLLDSACTWSLIAATDDVWTTVDLRTDYLRPAPAGRLVARGRVVTRGASVGRASAEVVDEAGRCCATATGTFARLARGHRSA